MMRRISDFLGRRAGRSQPPMRPNELRRDVVQAERRQREAARTPRFVPDAPFDEATALRQRPLVVPSGPAAPVNPLLGALKTRAGLRQAWLMSEILGPPVAQRRPSQGEREL